MSYSFNTNEDRRAMLGALGLSHMDELFASIPADLRFSGALRIPGALSELELSQYAMGCADRNAHAGKLACFLGGGSYDHYIPAVVDAIASRGEFYTSYTPYQPEVSQGNLQVMFEYQTLICQLTGMDVSNASLYDGGSAVAEAALMCMTVSKRSGNVVVPTSVHPEYRHILQTYLQNLDTQLVTVPVTSGKAQLADIAGAINADTACVIVQHPNFFGCLEDMQQLSQLVHERGALLVVVFDPISLGRLQRPADYGADVAVAEGQSLGSPLAFGGPYLGILACRETFLRRMPGRIAGQTLDHDQRRCWVLTLQTREQHIRREKATSNICTNQGLLALRATVYLATLGPQGLREVADLCLQKSHYAALRIAALPRFAPAWNVPFFKEFVVRDQHGAVRELLDRAPQSGLLAGVSLETWYPEWADHFLVTVTEKRTQPDIERLVQYLADETHTNSK